MEKRALLILRILLAITFFYVGISILLNPEPWIGYLKPWARNLLLIDPKIAMILTGILDLIIGVLFLVNPLVWLAGLLGSLHLLVVLITSGINAITFRDLGLLGSALYLFLSQYPKSQFCQKLLSKF